jgi:cytochrome b561
MIGGGDGAAWLAVALFPSTAVAGWVLRRFASGAIVERLRPHFWLGYGVLALGGLHGMMAMGRMGALSSANLWVATLALCGLGFQVFVGLNLQAPGAYRMLLRRWHIALTCIVATLIAGHVLLTL